MDIWNTRIISLSWLSSVLNEESNVINMGFDLHDECIRKLGEVAKTEGASLQGRFARVVGLTTTKAMNLILSCYSLTLDALAQESGALLRPLIETYELLVYFHNKQERVDEAIEGKLPSAGEIGQAINGSYQSLRTYLNKHASHFGLSYDSVKHLIDVNNAEFRTVQTHSLEVLRKNLNIINALQVSIVRESIICLVRTGSIVDDLAIKEDAWRQKSIKVFKQQNV